MRAPAPPPAPPPAPRSRRGRPRAGRASAAPAPPRPRSPDARGDGGAAPRPSPPPPPPPALPPQPLSEAAVLLAACGVGVATGAAVVGFNDAIAVVRDAVWAGAPLEATHWGRWARSLPAATALPLLLAPPTLAGAAVGALRAAAGGSLDDPAPGAASAAAAARAPVLRAAAAALTLGGGASLGPEGPAVDIGRSTARGVTSLLARASAGVQRARLPLLAAGAGAGVAAGFGAPIAGVFFAVETVLRPGARDPAGVVAGDAATTTPPPDESPGLTIAAVLLAAVLADVVARAGLGGAPAVLVPAYAPLPPSQLPATLALGALCGAVAVGWRKAEAAASAAADAAERAGVPPAALPAVAGLATGAIACVWPEVLYQGLGNVNAILAAGADGGADGYTPALLAQIAAAKVAATALCRGGRLVGGLYAPSILVGAALGGAVAGLAPGGAPTDAPVFALVGAAGVLAAECGVPLTAALLVLELTRDYVVVVPTLAAAGVAAWVAGGGLLPRAATVGAAMADAAAVAAAASDTPRASMDAADAAAAVRAVEDESSALCAAADAPCLVLPADTLLADALAALEAANSPDAAAVLLARDGRVAGVLTVRRARAAAAAARGGTAGDAAGDS